MFHNHTLLDAVRVPKIISVGGAVTFDPAALSVTTLSPDKLTATCNAASPSAFARSTTSHSSGKYYVEITCTSDPGGTIGMGVVDSTFTPGSSFIGSNTHGTAYYNSSSRYFGGSDLAQMAATFTTGDIVAMCIDLDNKKNWWRKTTLAFSPVNLTGDPAANVGGGDISTFATDVFVAVDFEGAIGAAFTLNVGPTFAFTAPSGFGIWT